MKLEFDDAGYAADNAELRAYYFEKVVTRNEQLPNGQTLRRQTKPARIEEDSPGYKFLRKRIKQAEKDGDRGARQIYRWLCQLRGYHQQCGGYRPPCLRMGESEGEGGGGGGAGVLLEAVVDLSADAPDVTDVDTFILEVMFVRVVKADPGAAGDRDSMPGASASAS